jgi:DNA modification methylase
MSELPDGSIQMCVTSPPYWGLRKYSGNQELIWGSTNHHEHEWGAEIIHKKGYAGDKSTLVGTQTADITKEANSQGQYCQVCNAWRGAYGLEPTPELYVQHTIEILREIRRVLRKDGVVFWNVGDTYFGSGQGYGDTKTTNKNHTGSRERQKPVWNSSVLKPKDLCLIPFRVAIAAQEDGWWVRSVIIWNKPNPMPESVKDRPTEAHEYILMLTKSARYYWDMEAVREPIQQTTLNDIRFGTRVINGGRYTELNETDNSINQSFFSANPNGRNLRSVWDFPTQPYREAHFATFPEKLPEICIKAASKECDLVLDPFAGSGTTLFVASKLSRRSVGYELSTEYCDLIIERNKQQVMELSK